jgi:excisionase family DNA binding protein
MKYGVFDVQKLDDVLGQYPETLGVDEVAEILKVKKETVWTMLSTKNSAGKTVEDPLPGYKTGKTWVIVRDEFQDWMLRRRNTSQ